MLIELTNRCNLNCKTCPRKRRYEKIGNMSCETFKETIDKIQKSSFEKLCYFAGFGEPMLNPYFFEMVKYAKRKDFKLILPTNATKITSDNMKWLRLIDFLQLSIDSLKDKTRRGQNPNDILKLIPLLNSYRINFGLNVALGKENWDELDDFIKLHINTRVIINFIAIKPIFDDDDFLFNEMKFLASKADELKEKIRPYPRIFFDESCRSFQYGRMRNNDLAIDWNGDIYPCSFAFFRDYKFGNINDFDSLNDVLHTDAMIGIGNGKHSICEFCKANDIVYSNENKKAIQERKKDINQFRDIHKDERCFLLGTGASITKEILESLKNEITIGMNRILYTKELWDFEPTYFLFSDEGVVTRLEFAIPLSKLKSIKLYSSFIDYQILINRKRTFSEDEKMLMANCHSIPWISTENHVVKNADMISLNLLNGTIMCGSVMQDVVIPFAAWIGCKEIYLLGCDFVGGNNPFYEPNNIKSTYSPLLKNQYKYFKEKLQSEGKKIFNCSPSLIPFIENKNLGNIIK